MKKKIGFVAPTLKNGGAERVVSALANYFYKEYNVIIITLAEAEIFYEINPLIKVIPLRDGTPSKNHISAIFANGLAIRKFNKIIRKENIDILLSYTTNANMLSIIASKQTKIPCIISERRSASINSQKFIWLYLKNILYKKVKFLVVQTEGNKKKYISLIPESKIKIIQNPISERFTSFKKTRHPDNQQLNILSVGRLIPSKAQHVLIEALSELKHLNWHLTIIGGGPTQDNLITLCRTLKINERVTFTGSIKNVIDYYQAADLFVFTSRTEGFPNALMEAHYSGLPCISTNCDYGPADIITDGEDGFLTPVDSIKTLKKKIEILLLNPNLRAKFSKNAMEKRYRFEMTKIAGEWNNLINLVLNR